MTRPATPHQNSDYGVKVLAMAVPSPAAIDRLRFGGLVPQARIPVGKGYQVPFARQIREQSQVMTGAVGLITDALDADAIITGGAADLVFIGRELLRDPHWAIHAAQALDAEQPWPLQYGYAVKRRVK